MGAGIQGLPRKRGGGFRMRQPQAQGTPSAVAELQAVVLQQAPRLSAAGLRGGHHPGEPDARHPRFLNTGGREGISLA